MIFHLKVKPDKKRVSRTSFFEHHLFLVDVLKILLKTFLWHCWPFLLTVSCAFLF